MKTPSIAVEGLEFDSGSGLDLFLLLIEDLAGKIKRASIIYACNRIGKYDKCLPKRNNQKNEDKQITRKEK